jgi:threonyl-tRNA synthetase
VQAVVCPVASDHEDHARSVADRLRTAGVRVEVSPADDGLGARIRRHKMEKVPHILVVGGDDVANDTVADNARGSDKPERDIPVGDFVERLAAEIRDHA